MKDTHKTIVVFRRWKSTQDIIALFPYLTDRQWRESYEHVGQHGNSDYVGVIRQTVPAHPIEYQQLQRELEYIGYNLKIQKRK